MNDRHLGGQTRGQMDGWSGACIDGEVIRWIDMINGQMSRWVGGWMDG